MKRIILGLVLAGLIGSQVIAQSTQLSQFHHNQPVSDTLYMHTGQVWGNQGYIGYSGNDSAVATGLKYKLVVDSVYLGNFTATIQQGRSYDLPISFTCTAGADFRVMLVGTPTVIHELYSCKIRKLFTTGPTFGMYLQEDWSDTCRVEYISSVTEANKFSFSTSPNPANNELNISFVSITSGELHLFDSKGSLLKRKSLANSHSEKLRLDLPAGIYILAVITENNYTTQKILLR